MPVLGDFEFVEGGNFSTAKPLKSTFKTGGRYWKGLGYLLVELIIRKEKTRGSGSVELRVNGYTYNTIPVNSQYNTESIQIVRFSEQNLFSKKENTFEAVAKNAAGWCGNVICHFHQSTG